MMGLFTVVRYAFWFLLVSLMCGGSQGIHGLAQKYQDATLEDIQRDVAEAIQLLNRRSFLPWQKEQINQMVPRLHLGMIELWLEFRRLQEEKESVWRKTNEMLTRSITACQEVAADVSHVKSDASTRLARVEGQLAVLLSKVEKLEVNRQHVPEFTGPGGQSVSGRAESGSQTGDTVPKTSTSEGMRGDTSSPRTAVAVPPHPSDNGMCPARILHRVSNLTQVLNGHTDLLVELYERVTALEEMGGPGAEKGRWILNLPEGSGGEY